MVIQQPLNAGWLPKGWYAVGYVFAGKFHPEAMFRERSEAERYVRSEDVEF